MVTISYAEMKVLSHAYLYEKYFQEPNQYLNSGIVVGVNKTGYGTHFSNMQTFDPYPIKYTWFKPDKI